METQEKHKRRGLIATIGYHILLVIAFIFLGLKYQDPPPEEGIPINFGYEDDGSGFTSQSAPEETVPTPQEVVEQQIDEVTTQDIEESVNVTEEKPKAKPTEKPKEKPKPTEEKPKPSNQLSDALKNTKNSNDAGTGEGEGITEGGGDQGDRDGDINSQNRNGGGSGNGNYYLGDGSRKAKNTPNPSDCPGNDEGVIVVLVRVNQSGKTTSVDVGVTHPDGTKSNITNSCLIEASEVAAKKTTWDSDSKARETQIGYIKYRFHKK